MSPEVTLRDIFESDLPGIFEFQSDPIANKISGFVPKTEDAFYAQWRKILPDPNNEKKAVLLNGTLAGYLVCFVRVPPDREVGYWIAREHWGKGLATKALSLFLHHYPARPLFARVPKRNAASLKVVQNNGFKIIGEDKFENSSGETYDEFLLRLTFSGE